MLRIGMVGEYPTDVECVSTLLMKKFKETISFFPLIYDVHGSNLENPKIKHILRREYQIEKPDHVIFIRDLDGIEEDVDLVKKRKDYFLTFNSVVDKKGILLLNIYELEALLLADIGKVEGHYDVKLPEIPDCMLVKDPKGFLCGHIRRYSTGENKKLFSFLEYEVLLNRCRYFERFDQDFMKMISN